MAEIKMKAPTKEEVRNSEEQKKRMIAEKIEKEKAERQNEMNEADRINAKIIIGMLSDMFNDGKVSSRVGCSICSIPWDICTDGTLAMINKYLGGEWFAKFENNTGNSDDFETTNTLRVKPRI